MSNQLGPLLLHLPEIYHRSEDLQKLLSVFEEILFGIDASEIEGLEQTIANISRLFDPEGAQPVHLKSRLSKTPDEFLPWLADWVALAGLDLVPEQKRRKLLANIVPLYASRGTKKYVVDTIGIFFPEANVTVDDDDLPSLTVGVSSIGKDTRLGGDIPFCFFVTLRFESEMGGPHQNCEIVDKVRRVIDLAKPAHTFYQLGCFFGSQN